jgi:hypothetical protein
MNLSEWMSRERSLAERLRAVETISLGLTQARNGKGAFLDPTRIQVTPDGTCRLREGMSSAAETGYRAPEFIGRGNPSPRADVFVAGVIAYQLLSGEHPFGGADPAETRPRPLVELKPDLPARLSEAVMACLEVDPEGRAKDITSLHEVVREVREHGAMESTQVGGKSPAAELDTAATLVGSGPLVDNTATLRPQAAPDMVSTLVPGTPGAQGVAAVLAAQEKEGDTAATLVPGGAGAAAVAEAASPGITTAPTLEMFPKPDSEPAPAAEKTAPALAVEAWPSAVTGPAAGAVTPPAVVAASPAPAPAAEVKPAPAPSPAPAPTTPTPAAARAAATTRPAPPMPAAPPAPEKSGGNMGVIAGVAALAVIGVGGFFWWRSNASSAPGSTLAASASSTPTLVASTPVPESILAATETTTVVRSAEPPKTAGATGPANTGAPAATAAAAPRPDATHAAGSTSTSPPPTVAAAPPVPEAPRNEPPPTTAPAAPVAAAPAPVAAEAEPASITNVSPPVVRRPSNALVDVHGAGFRPDHQARILRGGRPAPGVTVVRQRYVSPALLQVLLKLDSEASTGAYQLVVADGAGVLSNVKAFEVAK